MHFKTNPKYSMCSSCLSFHLSLVRFWKDKWYRDEPFFVSFPAGFALAISKDAWLADMWSSTVKGGGTRFSRSFND